jgi:hypothetical protein
MKNFAKIAAAALLSVLGSPLLYANLSYQVSVDTSPLSGVSGYMDFNIFGGIPFQDNVATISSFTSDSTLGGTFTQGDVAGTLTPGPLTLTADAFDSEWLQTVTFGNTTTFVLNVTTNFTTGSTPDSFAFYLLDSTQTPYATSDPSGADSIFVIDLTGASTAPQVFVSTAPNLQFTATVTPITSTSTPEVSPGSSVALGLAVMLGFIFLARRSRSV